jgi:hypothetical protein
MSHIFAGGGVMKTGGFKFPERVFLHPENERDDEIFLFVSNDKLGLVRRLSRIEK